MHGAGESRRPMFKVEVECESGGRGVAAVTTILGAVAHGSMKEGAIAKTKALGLRALAAQLDRGETVPGLSVLFTA